MGWARMGRWLTLLLIPAAFGLSVWSAVAKPMRAKTVGPLKLVEGAQSKTQAATNRVHDRQIIIIGPPAITMNKTVGTTPGACAVTKDIVVVVGTQVTYCYTVQNTGFQTLRLHDLVDSQLGVLLDDEPLVLPPFQSADIKASTPILIDTINLATWTAFNPGPTDSVFATSSARVLVITATPTNTPTTTSTSTPTNTPTTTSTPTPTNTVDISVVGPAPEIPTLSEWGAILMALMLAGVAALQLRSKR